MFRKIFGWLANRWVISALGIAVLCLLIWFVSEFVAFAGWAPFASPEARLAVILCIVVAWTIHMVWSIIRARKTDEQVIDGLAAAPDAPGLDFGSQASEEEIAVLRDRFMDSLGTLK